MTKQDNKILALLGFSVTGDMGPWSFYTSKRRQIVFYPRVPALNPPSRAQIVHRNRWRWAAQSWQLLNPIDRANWELASQRAKLLVTGYNLWIWWLCKQDRPTLATIERVSGIELLPQNQ